MAAKSDNHSKTQIDDGLYSRQLYAYGHDGHDAMKKMSETSVLISGMSGLGVEIAKNTILSGFKAVTVHDRENIVVSDMSSNYYAYEEDIGKNRAETVFHKLKELNPHVVTEVYTGELTEEYLVKFSVIVLTDSPLDEQIRINEFCRSQENMAFISCQTFGLFGYIFCDFGPNFLVTDINGEQPATSIVENITNEEMALVICVESKPHGLTSGDFIKFSNIKGMDELNSLDSVEIVYVDQHSFRIKYDTSKMNRYDNTAAGEITQVKPTKTLDFMSLKEALDKPEFVITNFSDFDRPVHLHAAIRAYNDYLTSFNSLPSFNDDDMTRYTEIIKRYTNGNDPKQELVDKIVHCLKSKQSNNNICPITSFFGGICSQEIMKASSGKFNPICQWMHFDAFECLPENFKELNTEPLNSRYDGQIAIFGREFQEKLANLRYFIVGSGAIGCELLKNFAMLGVGNIVITDMDTIERSNLSRQFLFRNPDIGQPKSIVAAKAANVMNPDVRIEAHLNRVGPETESIYNAEFFDSLDGVANALDNIQARKYMDSRCVLFGKSLLESGTLGTKGNVQVVKPFRTESYGSSEDPPEKSIPVCTIKNFPNQIEHTIQHARDVFHGRFYEGPSNLQKFVESNIDEAKTTIDNLTPTDKIIMIQSIKAIMDNVPKSFDDCVKHAYNLWYEDYNISIKQLLTQFPPDSVTSSGVPFWSGAKKCPVVFEFDAENDLHMNFILQTSSLWANVFKIPINNDMRYIKELLVSYKPPEFVPNNHVKISVTDEEEKERQKNMANDMDKMSEVDHDLEYICANHDRFRDLVIVPQEFEKDDDTNFHIGFITAASNMRATNYQIPTANYHVTKGIAGKIIPALATTTSVVGGLVTLELYKLLLNFDSLERYKNAFINLALPLFAFSDPIKAPVTKYKGKNYSLWDSFVVRGPMTLQKFIDHFEDQDMILDFITYESFMLYSTFINSRKLNERLDKEISEILVRDIGKEINGNMITLTIGVEPDINDKGEEIDVDLPVVKYYIN